MCSKFLYSSKTLISIKEIEPIYPLTIKFVLHLNFAVPPYQGDQLLVVFSLPQCVPGKVDQSECFI